MFKGELMKSICFAAGLLFISGSIWAGQAQGQSQSKTQGKSQAPPVQAPAPTPALKTGATPSGTSSDRGVRLEEIVARVNAEIITTVDLERSKTNVTQDARDECAAKHCTADELQQLIFDKQKDSLRDLIDQALLVQRAKDVGISVETDLVKRLDQLRIENKMATLEDLQKAVEGEGIDYEEFKNNIRSGLYTDAVISREVGSRISGAIDRDEIKKYYDEHQEEFKRPEIVYIREIMVSTDGKSELETAVLQKKADLLRERVLNGEDFGDLAKHFSDSGTAAQGGELGGFPRGKLSKQIEDAVFKLNRKEMTPVLKQDKGFLIIQVEERFEAGVQPLDKVENEVMSKLTQNRGPAKLREYLTTLRRDSFVEVREGYVDTGGGQNSIVAEAKGPIDDPNAPQKPPKKHKKFLLF
jgi:peptidyl-prolyl cis-trans isomerase SurA